MQAIQVFFNTGERMFPDKAREMVARLLDGQQASLMQAVMNYTTDNKSREGFPPVHFSNNKNGFSILGFGDIGIAAVSDLAPFIHKMIALETKKVVTIEQKLITQSAERRPYGITYTVPRMVVQKKNHHLELMKDPQAGAVHLEKLFLNSIKRQAESMGIELPNDLNAVFKGAKCTFTAKPSRDSTIALLGLRDATFELNARLGGVWACGYLLSKGYGNFNADMQLGTMRE